MAKRGKFANGTSKIAIPLANQVVFANGILYLYDSGSSPLRRRGARNDVWGPLADQNSFNDRGLVTVRDEGEGRDRLGDDQVGFLADGD